MPQAGLLGLGLEGGRSLLLEGAGWVLGLVRAVVVLAVARGLGGLAVAVRLGLPIALWGILCSIRAVGGVHSR